MQQCILSVPTRESVAKRALVQWCMHVALAGNVMLVIIVPLRA